MSRRFSLSASLAALALLVLSMASAPALAQPQPQPQQGTSTLNCIGNWYGASCFRTWRDGPFNPHVISVPGPQSDEERATAAARDRRWVERCRPLIQQDRYGVMRYSYSAPGCEFGRLD